MQTRQKVCLNKYINTHIEYGQHPPGPVGKADNKDDNLFFTGSQIYFLAFLIFNPFISSVYKSDKTYKNRDCQQLFIRKERQPESWST